MEESINSRKTERVGKVTLDLSVYSGTDFYCDGAVEDELLDISKRYVEAEFPGVIEMRGDWPTLYHLSNVRENIVRWLPISKNDKVLEVGSGCGAITGAFTKLAGEVISCDLSKKRSLINANRHMDADNLTIHVGNFTDVEVGLPNDFDYICLIGVFEYGASYINTDTPYEDFLKLLMKHLKPGGRIVIAIENRVGLKYFAGCKEDHVSNYFSGIEGYINGEGVRTFSKPGLMKIFKKLGLSEYRFYYPYPDYKLMHTLYSDERLPLVGELSDNKRNFDQDRMELFSEKAAYDSFIEDGIFDQFSNSYLVVLGPDVKVDYARFSNDRSREFAICTSIEYMPVGTNDVKVITKKALFPEGKQHILNLERYYEGLAKRYEESPLSVNRCELIEKDNEPIACFEYVNGTTLLELMDKALKSGSDEEFYKLFDKYVELIGHNEDASIADRDAVFSNILVDQDKWTLIDYEWTKESSVTTKEIAFRAIYCYMLEDSLRNKINLDLICSKLNLSSEAAALIKENEAAFQKKVTGNNLSLQEMRDKIGYKSVNPTALVNKYNDPTGAYQFQIYPGNPDGSFSEETSYFYKDAYSSDDSANVLVSVSPAMRVVRLDPLRQACIVRVVEAFIDDNPYPVESKKFLLCNGRRIGNDSFVFPTDDPNLIFVLEGLARNEDSILDVKLEITKLPLETAVKIFENIKRVF